MATANPQGIMALPAGGAPVDTDTPSQPQLGLDDSYDAVQQGLQNASPDAYSAVNAELAKLVPQLDQLPDEVLDQLLQIVQYMHDNPKEYSKALQELVNAGIIEEGDFPEEYDPEFLATLGMVIMQAKKSRQGPQSEAAQPTAMPMPPAGMARGGIAEAAHMVASKGRGRDTMLAHITPKEAKMLRAKGGMGTINPATGLPEYGWFSDTIKSVGNAVGGAVKGVANAVSGAVKGVASAVKSIVSSPIGKVLGTVALATFLGPGAFGITGLGLGTTASMALASGAVTALGGGNIKDVLKSAAIGGATAFFGAPGGAISNFVGGAVTNAAANAAITSGIVGTGIGLLSGQKLQDAVKSGLTAGAISGLATGATKGFSAQIDAPKVPTVGEMLDQNRPTAQQIEANVKQDFQPDFQPEGATPLRTDQIGNVEGLVERRPLPSMGGEDVVARMPDNQLSNMSPARPEIVMHDGVPKYVETDVNGNVTGFRTVPFAERNYSEFGTVSAKPADVSGSSSGAGADISSSYTGRTSMGPAYDTGFGPGADVSAPSAEAVGGPFDGVSPVKPPSTLMDTVTEGYDKYIKPYTPSEIQKAGVLEAEAAGNAASARVAATGGSPAAQDLAYTKAYEAAMPGVISTYGPVTAAGLGIAGLAGAFTPKKPQPSPEQQAMNARLQAERDRVAADPGAYAPQGMERFGIIYNDRGEITGSQPWNPQPIGPTEVAGNYMPYAPSPYMSPSGGIGNPFASQPYNTSSMYNFMPRYAAQGGMMSNNIPPSPVMRDMGGIASLARGGYPRRTGQISGPGTETSDSIPAMLSDGEFVMTAKAVKALGKGNRRAGAKKMYALMHHLEKNAARG